MGSHESLPRLKMTSSTLTHADGLLYDSLSYSNQNGLRTSLSEYQVKRQLTLVNLDTSDTSATSSNSSSKKFSDNSYMSSSTSSSSSSAALSSSSSSFKPTIISNRYVESDLYANGDTCTYCSTDNIKKKSDLNALTSALMKKLGINTSKNTNGNHRGSMIALRDQTIDTKRNRFERNKCVSMFVEAKIDEIEEQPVAQQQASQITKPKTIKSKLANTLKSSFSVFNLKSSNSATNLNSSTNKRILTSSMSTSENLFSNDSSVTMRPLSSRQQQAPPLPPPPPPPPPIIYQNQYIRKQSNEQQIKQQQMQQQQQVNCNCFDCKSNTKKSLNTNNKVIIQASTNDLLKCLVIYLNKHFAAHLNDFNSNECIQWLRSADKALLLQGWHEIAFINPVNLVFLYLIIRDTLYTHEISSMHELKSHILSCMYVAFSYMGNEISYPLKPFIADSENRYVFWQRIIGCLSQMSRSMLKINQDTRFFTELFTELKSHAIVILTNNRLSMDSSTTTTRNENNSKHESMARINTLPISIGARPYSSYKATSQNNQNILLPNHRQYPSFAVQREKTAKV